MPPGARRRRRRLRPLVVVGTEFADSSSLPTGVYGAGLLSSIGSRTSFDASKATTILHRQHAENATVRTIGGLGSDTFNVAGNEDSTPIDVISNDLLGHSGLIDLSIPGSGEFVQDISASVMDNEAAGIAVVALSGALRVFEGNTLNSLTRAQYSVVLTRPPEEDVRVTAAPSFPTEPIPMPAAWATELNGSCSGPPCCSTDQLCSSRRSSP